MILECDPDIVKIYTCPLKAERIEKATTRTLRTGHK